jgi:serine protein kinase
MSLEFLKQIDQTVKKEFEANRRVLTFDEYLRLLEENEQAHARHTRSSSQYALDMMDYFGKTALPLTQTGGREIFRFKLYDLPIPGGAPKLVGHEEVQTRMYKTIQTFARQGINNRMILLHGPNGSAKTTLLHGLMAGLERYSREPEGAVYSFHWIFPHERLVKGAMGVTNYSAARGEIHSYAKLPDEEIAAKISCELKDHPLLLIPAAYREQFLKHPEHVSHYLGKGDLCHRCKQIFEALLASYHGDFKKVLMHIQVERVFLSRRYRSGLVTVEPQMHVDAQYHQLTYNKNLSALPASLHNLNFFSLGGDLVDGNRGAIEYSDLLKRPIDSFKYLLIACETGSVNVGAAITYLDTLMLGSSNELQLDAFKEFPDFSSFKARMELIRVPYLLSVSHEAQIYQHALPPLAGEKHTAPHVAWTVALWAVLTRLKKPNSINYPPNVSSIISNLTPLDKARLYDQGEMPVHLSPEDRKLLRSNLKRIHEEYINIPYYEGRMGASVREMKSLISDAAQSAEYACLSPLAILKELESFVKRTSEYEFLKQDVKDGYHDAVEFITTVRNDYLNTIDREVRDSMGLYDSQQWEDFIKKYVLHVSHVLKKERVQNTITGKMEDPDLALISEFEKIVDAPREHAQERDAFRNNVIAQVGAWALDHPNQPVVYAKVFPNYWAKLERHFYESQKALLTKMNNALQVDDGDSEGGKLAAQTVENMKSKHHYCDLCAKEVIRFLMKKRY